MPPTHEQNENALGQVAHLESMDFTRNPLRPVLQGEATDALAWGELIEEERRELMETMVSFEGFSPEEAMEFMDDVIAGMDWQPSFEGLVPPDGGRSDHDLRLDELAENLTPANDNDQEMER